MITRAPSFVVSTFPHVRSVDWIVAQQGYRTFRVGRRAQFDETSRVYCPEWMTNERANEQLALCRNIPPIFSSEEWEWRQLDDPPRPAWQD